MSQHYNKPSFYASNNMNVAPPTSGVGMGNHAYSHQPVNDAYRFQNMQQQRQQDYVKPANPPLKMLVPSEMVGAIIGACSYRRRWERAVVKFLDRKQRKT